MNILKLILSWFGSDIVDYIVAQIKDFYFKWKRKSDQKKALDEYNKAVEEYKNAPPELTEEKLILLKERRNAFEKLFNPN